jgi:hypothetical protein
MWHKAVTRLGAAMRAEMVPKMYIVALGIAAAARHRRMGGVMGRVIELKCSMRGRWIQ